MENRSSKGLGLRAWGLGLNGGACANAKELVFAAFAVFAFNVVPAFAQQPERARTEALARRASERLQSLQREADRLAAQERTLMGDLRKLELERQLKAEELKQVDADAAKLEDELSGIRRRMDALQQSEREARPELSARLVDMYKLGQARYLRLLLSTPDLQRIGQASRTVAALAKLDRDRIASRKRTLDELKAAQTTLEERGRQLTATRAAAAKAEIAAATSTRSSPASCRRRSRSSRRRCAIWPPGCLPNPQRCRSGRSAASSTGPSPAPFCAGSDAQPAKSGCRPMELRLLRLKIRTRWRFTTERLRLPGRFPNSGIW